MHLTPFLAIKKNTLASARHIHTPTEKEENQLKINKKGKSQHKNVRVHIKYAWNFRGQHIDFEYSVLFTIEQKKIKCNDIFNNK